MFTRLAVKMSCLKSVNITYPYTISHNVADIWR
jgi:hypothetical protein